MSNSNKSEDQEMLEESHYHHVIGDFVELLVIYGFIAVIRDVILRIERRDSYL